MSLAAGECEFYLPRGHRTPGCLPRAEVNGWEETALMQESNTLEGAMENVNYPICRRVSRV
jgi:hypothetical protein